MSDGSAVKMTWSHFLAPRSDGSQLPITPALGDMTSSVSLLGHLHTHARTHTHTHMQNHTSA